MPEEYIVPGCPAVVHSLAGIPWEVRSCLPPGRAYLFEGVLYADSVDTVRKLVDELNRRCGV